MLPLRRIALLASIFLVLAAVAANGKEDARESLWAAVRSGDVKDVKALIDKGADVNAKNEIGITALWIAASKGKPEVVELLLAAGADVNARDGIWYETPLSSAVGEGNAAIVTALLRAGARDIDAAVLRAAAGGALPTLRAVLDNRKPRQDGPLDAALFAAPTDNKAVREALEKAGAMPLKPAPEKDRDDWKPLAGAFESENGGKLTVEVLETGIAIRRAGVRQTLRPTGKDVFRPLGLDVATYAFERKGASVDRVILKQYTAEVTFYRLESKSAPEVVKPATETGEVRVAAALNWPAFRGPDASGVADGQHPPLTWDVKAGTKVRWKTPLPGLGHSCPIVWGDRVFVTTAVSGDPDPKVRTGNYGDVESVNDVSKHVWQVLCLDRDTGKIQWTRTAFEGVPKIKRHLKGSQANCTPATDGKHLVACFGPEGLYCYDFQGKLLWKRDLSSIDSSFAIDQQYEWGFGSSPIIHDGLVILQCDLSKDSFIAAYRLEDGSRVWSTPRDEIPSWSSPVVWRNGVRAELVTNASQYARGYDPATGKELWRLAKKSECTIPAPVIGRDLVYVVSGNRPIQPIFALRPGATGNVSLQPNEDRNSHVAWSKMRGGSDMTTPIVYGKYLYVCSNAGMLTCYEADTGKEVYKERLGGISYTASPVAADGRLYFTSEQGVVRVVKAGPEFELLAVNELGDTCMATPAISAGMLLVRSQHFLFALGRDQPGKAPIPKVAADPLDGPPFVSAKAWVVIDGKSGKLVRGSNEAEARPIASTTKIMTAWLVLRLASADPRVLDEVVTYSELAAKTTGSSAGLKAGEKLPVKELLYGLLLPSGNDAAVALGEHFGPRLGEPADGDGLQRFVVEMNRRAKALGLKETSYKDPNGLSRDNLSSTRDLAALTFEAMKDERFRSYVATRRHDCEVVEPGGSKRKVVWTNTNKLLDVEGYEGVKTGTTMPAGNCLVASARRGEDRLIVVVLGSTSADGRYVDARNLFRWAWRELGHKP